jgi:hypothetical protein
MELKLNIQYQELLQLIQQLPEQQIEKLKNDLNKITKSKKQPKTDFQKLLLDAPVMDDEEYENYLESRKLFNQWRTN